MSSIMISKCDCCGAREENSAYMLPRNWISLSVKSALSAPHDFGAEDRSGLDLCAECAKAFDELVVRLKTKIRPVAT